MGAWTKLTAVNRILRAGGENPVSTLASTSGDALMAEAILDEANLECQLAGLAANTESLDFTPDADMHVVVADNVLHVTALNMPDKFITTRGSDPTLLYNVTDNTDEFDVDPVRLRLVVGIAYDDLPFAQQVYVADEAARRYQLLVVGDGGADSVLRELWMQSRMRARADDIRSRNVNIFGSWASRLPFWGAKRTQRSRWSL